MRQKGLTVITPVIPGKEKELKILLNEVGGDIQKNDLITFSLFSTVHFMRWVILDPAIVRGEHIPAQLVLSTNFDGEYDAHLDDLLNGAYSGFCKIYSYCENVPAGQAGLKVYLKEHIIPIAAFYRGTTGRSLAQIRDESLLRDSIETFLQEQKIPEKAETLYDTLISFLRKDREMNWAFTKYKHEAAERFGKLYLALGLMLGIGLYITGWIFFWIPMAVLSALVVLFVAVWWTRLKSLEKKDRDLFITSRQDADNIARLTLKEDYKIQNQITHLVNIKPGKVRLYTLKFVLWAINLLARLLFNKGSLGGIQSIHYARWVIIDNGKRLLFFSNYDGSWESYLGEFVDRASVGLTGVWSNTEGFPPTRNLIREGARNSKEFKAWAREKQIETQVWYSAYPTTSIKNINNNTAIREGLYRKLSGTEISKWLKKL